MVGSCLVLQLQHPCWDIFLKSKIKAGISLEFQYKSISYQKDWTKNLLDFGCLLLCFVRVANWHWPVQTPRHCPKAAREAATESVWARAPKEASGRFFSVFFGLDFFLGDQGQKMKLLVEVFFFFFNRLFLGMSLGYESLGSFCCWDCWSFFVVDDFCFVFW